MIGAISGFSGMNSYYSMYLTRNSLLNNAQSAPGAQELQNTQNAQRSGGVWTGRRAASPETPVQPVAPVTPISADKTEPAGLGLPAVREGADPAEMAVRMRIRPYEEENETAQSGETEDAMGAEGVQKAVEEGKCETCEKRKYQDGSDDMGVSFQTPTRIAPEQVASAVRGHEQEHVVREQAKARRENRRVVSQYVTLHTNICPECGKVYISGGTTRTVTAAEKSQETQQETQEETEDKGFSVFG